MSVYPKPKRSNTVFNALDYTNPKDSVVDIDLTGYIQKSGDIMSGTLVLPSLNTCHDKEICSGALAVAALLMLDID